MGEGNNSLEWHHIELSTKRTINDIESFIDEMIEKKNEPPYLLAGGGQVDEKLEARITEQLLKSSDRVFRHTIMQIEHLYNDRRDEEMILEEFRDCLRNRESITKQNLADIAQESIERFHLTAQTTLRWLLCVRGIYVKQAAVYHQPIWWHLHPSVRQGKQETLFLVEERNTFYSLQTKSKRTWSNGDTRANVAPAHLCTD